MSRRSKWRVELGNELYDHLRLHDYKLWQIRKLITHHPATVGWDADKVEEASNAVATANSRSRYDERKRREAAAQSPELSEQPQPPAVLKRQSKWRECLGDKLYEELRDGKMSRRQIIGIIEVSMKDWHPVDVDSCATALMRARNKEEHRLGDRPKSATDEAPLVVVDKAPLVATGDVVVQMKKIIEERDKLRVDNKELLINNGVLKQNCEAYERELNQMKDLLHLADGVRHSQANGR